MIPLDHSKLKMSINTNTSDRQSLSLTQATPIPEFQVYRNKEGVSWDEYREQHQVEWREYKGPTVVMDETLAKLNARDKTVTLPSDITKNEWTDHTPVLHGLDDERGIHREEQLEVPTSAYNGYFSATDWGEGLQW